MKIVIQRVTAATVTIENIVNGQIDTGMLILLRLEQEDDQADADWLIQKVIGLRIFNDFEGKMNLSVDDVNGAFLVVSQFTLHASIKKGNRPSYIQSAKPEHGYRSCHQQQPTRHSYRPGQLGGQPAEPEHGNCRRHQQQPNRHSYRSGQLGQQSSKLEHGHSGCD